MSSRLIIAGVLAAVALLAALVPLPPDAVERLYSGGIYPRLQRVVTPLANHLPVALLDIAGTLLFAWLIHRVVRTGRRGGTVEALKALAIDGVFIASIGYLWFLTFWGLNYRRAPLESHLDFDARRVDHAAVVRLAHRAVFELNRLHPIAHRTPWADFDQLRRVLAAPFAHARELVGATWQSVEGRAKWSTLDAYFRQSGVDGMTDPFFLEVLVNHDVLPFERPFVLAHEWAHLGGAAVEAEASFMAWLTCVRSSAQHQYSAWESLYLELVARLAREERSELAMLLHTGPRQDLDAVRARLLRASPAVRRTASRVYDQYLRANRVEGGIASYGRVVQLVAGTRFDEGWVPKKRDRGDGEQGTVKNQTDPRPPTPDLHGFDFRAPCQRRD